MILSVNNNQRSKVRPHISWGLIWIHIVCKGNLRTKIFRKFKKLLFCSRTFGGHCIDISIVDHYTFEEKKSTSTKFRTIQKYCKNHTIILQTELFYKSISKKYNVIIRGAYLLTYDITQLNMSHSLTAVWIQYNDLN